MKKISLGIIIILFILSSSITQTSALPQNTDYNQIYTFTSRIETSSSGLIIVEETINLFLKSNVDNITRTIPLSFDYQGIHKIVDVKILEVKENNNPISYTQEIVENDLKLNVDLSKTSTILGNHTIQIKFEYDRAFDFQKEKDLLIYPVTGFEWDFPIDKVFANVILPNNVESSSLDFSGMTGKQGGPQKDYKYQIGKLENKTMIIFYTTNVLNAKEGFILGLNIPKGIISEPNLQTKINYFLNDVKLLIMVPVILLIGTVGLIGFKTRQKNTKDTAI